MIIKNPDTMQIPALRQLWQQAFGDTDAFMDGFFHTGFSPNRCRCIIADEQPVAALYWFDCTWQGKKIAYIYAVATDLQCRGKGLCRALMENTHLHLRFQGYDGAVLVPGTPSLATMYEKLGYQAFCHTKSACVCAQAPAVSAQPVSASDFAQIRNARLPKDAVVHGAEALDFLATFCDFYAGDDFLLCAAREQNTLHIQEYLGDVAKLPGVLAGLQVESAIVRIPGDTIFAMYRDFAGNTCLPGYFGIALD